MRHGRTVLFKYISGAYPRNTDMSGQSQDGNPTFTGPSGKSLKIFYQRDLRRIKQRISSYQHLAFTLRTLIQLARSNNAVSLLAACRILQSLLAKELSTVQRRMFFLFQIIFCPFQKRNKGHFNRKTLNKHNILILPLNIIIHLSFVQSH